VIVEKKRSSRSSFRNTVKTLSIAMGGTGLATGAWQPLQRELGRVYRGAQRVSQSDGARREAGAQRPREGRNAGLGVGRQRLPPG
jgi:hypothetical protein